MKNTGKASEEEFERRWKALGKRAFLYRFEDQGDLHGLNKKVVLSRCKPADYLVVVDGEKHFAEVKSSSDRTAFRFSQIRETQQGFARLITAANGGYFLYVHHVETDFWALLPWQIIQNRMAREKKSIPWSEMEAYQWNTPT